MASEARRIGPYTKLVAFIIKDMREALPLTQLQLAHIAEIKPATMSKIERGVSTIDMEQVHRIAVALGVTPGAILKVADREIGVGDLVASIRLSDVGREAIALAAAGRRAPLTEKAKQFGLAPRW